MLEVALFPRKLASHFRFFDFFCNAFYVGSGSKSGSAKAKSNGSSSSGSTTLIRNSTVFTVSQAIRARAMRTVEPNDEANGAVECRQ